MCIRDRHRPEMVFLTTSGRDAFFHKIAEPQVRDEAHFVAIIHGEVPGEWLALAWDPEVVSVQAGQTTVLTTSQVFLEKLTNSKCSDPSGDPQWSWSFAVTVVEGLEAHHRCYPSIKVGPGGREPKQKTEFRWNKCDGCRWRARADDPAHSRVVGECQYPHVEPVVWPCEGCKSRCARWHHKHTYKDGECKWATAPYRQSKARSGQHPCPGRIKATDEPTAGLPPNNPDGELGAGDEAAAPPAPAQDRSVEDGMQVGGASSSASGSAPPLDGVERPRRQWRDAATGEAPADWSQYDVQRTLRALGCQNEAGRRRLIRKLHLRWWHAAAAPMKRILKHAGMPDSVLNLVDEIVDTCSVCRTWKPPMHASIATASLPLAFNDQVEIDLLFYKKLIILHMVCRCTRWHAGRQVANKTMEALIPAIDECWCCHHGSMKELILDGEGALAKDWDSRDYFSRKSIKVTIRAPGQHARFIERRGALLRESLHKIETQLQDENIHDIPFPQILAEAIFSGNALISINNATPYNAVYGRVPNILPDINAVALDGTGALPGTIRHSHRLREISVQTIVSGTAKQRLDRALATPTLPAAQQSYSLGDQVDFYRPPNQKDLPGWNGPANVIDTVSYTHLTLPTTPYV